MSRLIFVGLILVGAWVIFTYVLNGEIKVSADLPTKIEWK